ncbi:unnamed protein product [Amaranthus hypochondriacus]
MEKMRPKSEGKRAQSSTSSTRSRSSSLRSRTSKTSPPSASLIDQSATELITEFEEIQLADNSEYNPRSFPYSVKQQCWEKAEKVKGRDPSRWRRDPLGNIVFRKLVGCPGCLCHDYDHILPYSKVLFISTNPLLFQYFTFFLYRVFLSFFDSGCLVDFLMIYNVGVVLSNFA